MAQTSRANILQGPAFIGYNSGEFFAEGDISVDIITEYFDVNASTHGTIGKRVRDRRVEASFTPRQWASLTTLFPYATTQIGDRLFPASDRALVVTPRNGAPLTIDNAAVTKLPSIILSAKKSMLGPMTFTGLVADGGDPATDGDLFSFGTPDTGATMGAFDGSNIINAQYTLARNSVNYASRDGFQIDFDLQTQPVLGDSDTLTDFIVSGLGASLTFSPYGKTEAQLATLLAGGGAAVGAQPTGYDCVISGANSGNPEITLDNMIIEKGGTRYGGGAGRHAPVTLRTVRTISSAALTALWTFGTVS